MAVACSRREQGVLPVSFQHGPTRNFLPLGLEHHATGIAIVFLNRKTVERVRIESNTVASSSHFTPWLDPNWWKDAKCEQPPGMIRDHQSIQSIPPAEPVLVLWTAKSQKP